MQGAEQRWRAGEFVHYIPPLSPTDFDEDDHTLVPNPESSFEDTLVDDILIVEDNNDNKEDVEVDTDNVKVDENNEIIVEDNDLKVKSDKTIEKEIADENVEVKVEDDVFKVENGKDQSEQFKESYSLEMKLVLGIEDDN